MLLYNKAIKYDMMQYDRLFYDIALQGAAERSPDTGSTEERRAKVHLKRRGNVPESIVVVVKLSTVSMANGRSAVLM